MKNEAIALLLSLSSMVAQVHAQVKVAALVTVDNGVIVGYSEDTETALVLLAQTYKEDEEIILTLSNGDEVEGLLWKNGHGYS